MANFSLADLRDLLVRCGGLPASTIVDDPDLTLQDLGIDSACLLGVQVQLERQLGVELTADDMTGFTTLGGGVERVNRKLQARV